MTLRNYRLLLDILVRMDERLGDIEDRIGTQVNRRIDIDDSSISIRDALDDLRIEDPNDE
jgi:hypothetical protein